MTKPADNGPMCGNDQRWPSPRLTGYALWLIVSRLGAPIVLVAMVFDLALG